MKKKFIAVAAAAMIACFGAFALTACGGGSNNGGSQGGDDAYKDLDPITMISSDATSPGSACDEWQNEIAAQVSEITGGKFVIEHHGNGELGGDLDVMTQEQNGDIQLFATQPATMVAAVPGLACMDLPMVFNGYTSDQIDATLNGDNEFTQGLQAEAEKAGVHILGWLQDATFRQVTSNTELRTLADYKGFQIRTMENKNHMAFWAAVGAEPTPMAWAEVYFALQNGTVDGQENATDTCTGNSLQEVQKYLCRTNHILYGNLVSINLEQWNALDPAYQEALTQAVANATATIRPQLGNYDLDNEKVMTDAGMEVITYDEQFFTDFLNNEGVQAVYADISKQTNGLSDKLIATLEASK